MKTLIFNNEEIQAERIVKNPDSIIGYNGQTEIFAFRGISDFSGFMLKDGESFDTDELSLEERNRADIDYIAIVTGVNL